MGYRAAGKEFSPSVVELNKIYDNIGPGFVENVNTFEVGSIAAHKCRFDEVIFGVSNPFSVQNAKIMKCTTTKNVKTLVR